MIPYVNFHFTVWFYPPSPGKPLVLGLGPAGRGGNSGGLLFTLPWDELRC